MFHDFSNFLTYGIVHPLEFVRWKNELMVFTGLERDALHVYIGTLSFLVLYLLIGWRWWGRLLAITFVVAGAYWGERLDYSGERTDLPMFSTGDHLHDFINTITLPVLLYLFGRVIFNVRSTPQNIRRAE